MTPEETRILMFQKSGLTPRDIAVVLKFEEKNGVVFEPKTKLLRSEQSYDRASAREVLPDHLTDHFVTQTKDGYIYQLQPPVGLPQSTRSNRSAILSDGTTEVHRFISKIDASTDPFAGSPSNDPHSNAGYAADYNLVMGIRIDKKTHQPVPYVEKNIFKKNEKYGGYDAVPYKLEDVTKDYLSDTPAAPHYKTPTEPGRNPRPMKVDFAISGTNEPTLTPAPKPHQPASKQPAMLDI